jgi:hypothetical protein
VTVILGLGVLLRRQSQPESESAIATNSRVQRRRSKGQFSSGEWLPSHERPRAGSFNSPETFERAGVARKTEMRFSTPNYYRDVASGTRRPGFGDLTIGMKRQLGPAPSGFDVSVIVFLSLPSGADVLSSYG